jgi:hypothetical protein
MIRAVQPCSLIEGGVECRALELRLFCSITAVHLLGCDNAGGFRNWASAGVVRCQPWFYLRLVA